MKTKILNKSATAALIGLLCVAATSCKKNKEIEIATPEPPVTTVTATREQLTQDSIFLYAKQVYLWNTSLPEYAAFNPRQYAGTLDGFKQELYALTQYSPNNSATSFPYEYTGTAGSAKYSYIDDISTHNVISAVKDEKSSVDLEGVGNDFGLRLGGYRFCETCEPYSIYVQAVYQGSPVDLKGLTRGAVITKINGITYGASISTESAAVNTALNASNVTIAGFLKDGVTAFNYTLNKTTYKSSPIYAAKVLAVNGTKVGYLAYARFSNMDNSKAGFDAAFADFASQGVTKLVIDLRYNGGGYVSTAQYLLNLIATPALTGQVMFKERYNTLMQTGTATIMKNQPLLDDEGKFQYVTENNIRRVANYTDLAKDYFSEAKQVTNFSKAGPLQGVTDVVFIVTRSTASASELVINSLKPYLNVKIAGTNSYGKPIGFFPITLDYKLDATTKKETGYDVYYSMFQTTNSRGEGEYFNGFTPDLYLTGDDAAHDFGDLKENNLARALSLIISGPLTSGSTSMSIQGTRVSTSAVTVKPLRDGAEFNGMIVDRPKLKL
jgi:carboxyl-terminal processing protease